LAEHVANADVVHIHDLTTRWGECALLAAAAWKRPICVTEHGFGTSRLGPAVNARKLATVGAGPSRYGASLIGATKRDSLVFGGGVDDEFFHPPASTNDRPAVLIASPIDSARDAQALEELLPDAAEVFVGGRVSEDVVLHQRMQRVRSPQEFREAAGRCFAVIGPRPGNPESTRPEPALPLTMLAAMACGVPPVASPVGAVSEIVTNAVSGFLVEHDGDIASVVRLLSREPDLVMSVGQAARETCADWNLSGATERLVTLYREIAAA
jgi:glycosyltransferase involved in cell wall biosynthesis